MGRRARPFVALVAASLLLTVPERAVAQRVAGVGDDAIPIPRGGFRLGIGAIWNSADDVYRRDGGSLRRQPLLGAMQQSAFRPAGLDDAESALRNLSGLDAFTISLGELEARGALRESIAPIQADYGITRRLSAGLVVPYVESRLTTRFLLNRTGVGASVGQNPAFLTSGAAARAQNTLLLQEIDAARTALADELVRCATPLEADCDIINANRQAAQALVVRSQQFYDGLLQVFGSTTAASSFVAPISGSALDEAIVGNLGALRSDFSQYGIDSIAETSRPAAATVVLGPAGINRLANSLGYSALGNTRRAGIGDIDLTASFLVFDSFDADQVRRFSPTGTNVRSMISGGVRVGTANAERTDDPFDIPTGEGTNALLLRSTTDVTVGSRFWVSATVRAVRPLSDNVVVAVPVRDAASIWSPFTVEQARRDLAMRLRFEVAPRFAIGEFFGISGAYQHARRGADMIDVRASETTTGGTMTLTDARTLHSVALGVSYSSLASYTRGRSRLPVEVFFVHSEPIGASGNNVPAVATDRLEIRVYTGFPRR